MRRAALFAAALAAAVLALLMAVRERPPAAPARSARPASPRPLRVPPPMFSREYTDALRGVLEMEAPEAEALERRLRAEPEAWTVRLRLLAYHMRADRLADAGSRRARVRHVLWLIENQPACEILRSPYGRLEPGLPAADEERRAAVLWERALAARPHEASLFCHAAQFFRERNEGASLRFLRTAAELEPANWHYGFALGERLGWRAVSALRLGDAAAASAALRELEESNNPAVLEPAVRLLQSEYNSSQVRGEERPALGERARRLFDKLVALNPDVDRAWVSPAPPPVDPPRPTPVAEQTVRRLNPADFPELPPAVAAVLSRRGCTIPQPDRDGPGVNVIRGEFFEAGSVGWAVLCSTEGKSSILVFRSGQDEKPEALGESEDANYYSGTGQAWTSYSRRITAVDRKFIVSHYRAYGGPRPPAIGHHGIDDAFLEKASVVWYRHGGKWVRLQGAD